MRRPDGPDAAGGRGRPDAHDDAPPDPGALLGRRAEHWIATGRRHTAALVAVRAGRLGFVADVRPFAKGEYGDPFIELLALAYGIGADELTAGVLGRAWSMDDPVPPVAQGVDLRQRVLHVCTARRVGAEVERGGVLLPFEVARGTVVWAEPVQPAVGEGWIADVLEVVAGAAASGTATGLRAEDAALQLQRCRRLGHRVHLEPWLEEELRPWLRR